MLHLLAMMPFYAPDDGAGGGGGGGGTGGAGDAPKTVAHEHFQRVVEAKTNLEAENKNLKAQIQTLTEKAATVDTLSSEVTRWKGEAEKAQSRFATFTEFSSVLGTTDVDVIDQFDAKYRALPEKDRPARGDWVKSLQGAPDQAPTVLRPWLTAAADTGSGQGGGDKKPPPKNPVKPNAAGGGAPADAAELRRIRQEAMKSGNWQPYKDYKKAHGLA